MEYLSILFQPEIHSTEQRSAVDLLEDLMLYILRALQITCHRSVYSNLAESRLAARQTNLMLFAQRRH